MWIHFSPVETLSVKVLLGKHHNKSRKEQPCSFTWSMGFLLLSLKAGSKENKDLNEVLSKIDRHLWKRERQITTRAHRETQLLHHKRKMPLCATEADFISPLWRRAQLSLTPRHWEDQRQSSRALLHEWDLLKTVLTGGVSSPFPSPAVISSYTLHTLC